MGDLKESMQLVASAMSSKPIPVCLDRLCSVMKKASKEKLPKLQCLTDRYVTSNKLWPSWCVAGGDTSIPRWSCKDPNLLNWPSNLMGVIAGSHLYALQGELYFLARLGGNQDWIDYYANGGNLWDKIKEGFGSSYHTGLRLTFFNWVYGDYLVNLHQEFPWVGHAREDYRRRYPNEVRTLCGTTVTTSGHSPHRSLGLAVRWSFNEAIRNAVLEGFEKSREAPHVPYHDGIIVPDHLASVYTRALEGQGLRVAVQDIEGPRSEVKPKTRFDIMDEF